ncbi:MAG TPA: VIT1/CCC1 transporter family protein [Candidatus Nanopelagicales bacterium]|nr:VIT1/CCC1 transporter family protein [Candidatus Nanopelagicales bacterium]
MSGAIPPDDHHRDVTGGWLRPAVFGAMDGLVSNFALMAGVAGGSAALGAGTTGVVLAGLAGLAAGAFSMAAGEYTSVASQSELAEQEFENERIELRRNAEGEAKELAQIWVRRGVDLELAEAVAMQLGRNPEAALEVHAKEEIGLAPGELPNPWLAAGSSFLAFSLGALIPLVPYFFGVTVLWPSAILSMIGLFGAGALVSRVTARSWWFSGLRQLAVGVLAAVVTYGVGTLVGTSLA